MDAKLRTLDDYKEGTFTPVPEFRLSTLGVTYSAKSGRYRKIGKWVCIPTLPRRAD